MLNKIILMFEVGVIEILMVIVLFENVVDKFV